MKIEKLTRVQVLNFRNVICIRKCKENLAGVYLLYKKNMH